MARGKRRLRTGGAAWGQRRVDLGVSLRQLEEASGVSRGDLSKMERGRMVPTGDEFNRVMTALEAVRAEGPTDGRAPVGPEAVSSPGS